MVTVPTTLLVQADDKQIAAFQVVEQVSGIAGAQDGIARVGAHLGEDGGTQEKALHLSRLSLKDLLGQVVEDVAIAAPEMADYLIGGYLGSLGHGGERQLQAGRPSFGPLLQQTDLGLGQRQMGGDLGNLFEGEAQMLSAQLGQVTAGSQARQGKGWLDPGRDQKVHGGRLVLQEEIQHAVGIGIVDPVIILQNDQEVVLDGGGDLV